MRKTGAPYSHNGAWLARTDSTLTPTGVTMGRLSASTTFPAAATAPTVLPQIFERNTEEAVAGLVGTNTSVSAGHDAPVVGETTIYDSEAVKHVIGTAQDESSVVFSTPAAGVVTKNAVVREAVYGGRAAAANVCKSSKNEAKKLKEMKKGWHLGIEMRSDNADKCSRRLL
jgi:hypothetical protein